MQKYKSVLLVLFILGVATLVFMNTGTRVVENKPACINNWQGTNVITKNFCIKVQPEKAYHGRYSQYVGLEIALCIVVIFTGSAYVYTNLPKRLIRNSIEKTKKEQ